MQVRIESDQELPAGADSWIERHARLAFGRNAPYVRQIRVQLRWLPPATGKVMVSCRGMGSIAVATSGGDPLGKIMGAIVAASRQLDRKLRLSRALSILAR